jgi:hypothetical protein
MREDYFDIKSNKILNKYKVVHAYMNKFNRRSMVKKVKRKKMK